MDAGDIKKELDSIKMPKKRSDKAANLDAPHAGVKVLVARVVAILLVVIIIGFSAVLLAHFYGNADMTRMGLIVVAYLLLGGYLAYRLWNLTYFGWLFTLLLSGAGVFLSLLTVYNKGLLMPVLGVMLISALAAIALWWIRDLFGVKSFGDIFKPG